MSRHLRREKRDKETAFWDGMFILCVGAIGITLSFVALSYTRRQEKRANSLELGNVVILQQIAQIAVSVSILILFWGAIFIAIGRS